MSLQSSKEHKVNGMTTTAVCSPHPNPLPGGARGLLSARINLWGTLSPVGEGRGEGIRPHNTEGKTMHTTHSTFSLAGHTLHRISFLIDADGKVEHVFDDFKTSNHHDVVLNWLKQSA